MNSLVAEGTLKDVKSGAEFLVFRAGFLGLAFEGGVSFLHNGLYSGWGGGLDCRPFGTDSCCYCIRQVEGSDGHCDGFKGLVVADVGGPFIVHTGGFNEGRGDMGVEIAEGMALVDNIVKVETIVWLGLLLR